jgi:hypothetical protein
MWYMRKDELPQKRKKDWLKEVEKAYENLKACIVIPDELVAQPIPVEDVLQEVFAVHACFRGAFNKFGKATGDRLCTKKHNIENKMYVMLGNLQGYNPQFKRNVSSLIGQGL